MVNVIAEKSGRLIFWSALAAVLTVFLSVLPLGFLIWIHEAGEPGSFLAVFTYVLSGRVFDEGWNPVHAGTAIDQPTIGKWFFWFSVFAVAGLSYMAVVRKLCVRLSRLRHWIYAAGLTALCLFLVCLLTIPFWWLIQYINTMGWTGRRFFGLLYGLGWYLSVLGFWYKATVPTGKALRQACVD